MGILTEEEEATPTPTTFTTLTPIPILTLTPIHILQGKVAPKSWKVHIHTWSSLVVCVCVSIMPQGSYVVLLCKGQLQLCLHYYIALRGGKKGLSISLSSVLSVRG